MLQLDQICFAIDKEGEEHHLIRDASLKVAPGHFMAIVGPSGCGKTTLLKVIAGLNEETGGKIFWRGRDLAEEGDLEPTEIGYVPQFSIAFDELTVEESVASAARLRVHPDSTHDIDNVIDSTLAKVGMEELRDRRVAVLSGGQKRRLGLALELVSNPTLLLCDEVTSGLDPKSEEEIVRLMHELAGDGRRVVVNVTHSLSNLDLYDSVLVLFAGRVVYHGPPDGLTHYFSVDSAEDVYPRLARREPSSWAASWSKHAEAYDTSAGAPGVEDDEEPAELPGRLTQFWVLFTRRWRIFLRDRTQILLHLAMLLGFPLLVVVFGLEGIPQPKHLPAGTDNAVERMAAQVSVTADHLKIGGLISGLVMFQVILLTLMGSNNSAREIAAERPIFEKEKFGGLHTSSYIASKFCFLAALVLVQALWMGIFVQIFVPALPGDIVTRLAILILVNAAMTAICLGISGVMRTPEQSTLLSIYLVGFQLPLSGAVLALPGWLEPITRPFISAFWGWSGNLDSMKNEVYGQAINKVTEDTALVATPVCVFVLVVHIGLGIAAAYIGARRHQWN